MQADEGNQGILRTCWGKGSASSGVQNGRAHNIPFLTGKMCTCHGKVDYKEEPNLSLFKSKAVERMRSDFNEAREENSR